MKAWKIEYRVQNVYKHDTALVLATTANGAAKKLRTVKHIGGTRIVSIQQLDYDVLVK